MYKIKHIIQKIQENIQILQIKIPGIRNPSWKRIESGLAILTKNSTSKFSSLKENQRVKKEFKGMENSF